MTRQSGSPRWKKPLPTGGRAHPKPARGTDETDRPASAQTTSPNPRPPVRPKDGAAQDRASTPKTNQRHPLQPSTNAITRATPKSSSTATNSTTATGSSGAVNPAPTWGDDHKTSPNTPAKATRWRSATVRETLRSWLTRCSYQTGVGSSRGEQPASTKTAAEQPQKRRDLGLAHAPLRSAIGSPS